MRLSRGNMGLNGSTLAMFRIRFLCKQAFFLNTYESIYRYMFSLPPPTEFTGPSIGKWALVDVAHNDTRGSAQRLSEKRIRQATARASLVSETSDHSSQDLVRALEQAAEQRCSDIQRRHQLHAVARKGSSTEAASCSVQADTPLH